MNPVLVRRRPPAGREHGAARPLARDCRAAVANPSFNSPHYSYPATLLPEGGFVRQLTRLNRHWLAEVEASVSFIVGHSGVENLALHTLTCVQLLTLRTAAYTLDSLWDQSIS